MRGFDAANKIVGESVGVHGSAIANDPVLQRLSLCVDDLLPALSRACRVYGDGAAMHAMIALTASMARENGLEETIAESFRVNAALLDHRPLRHVPGPGLDSARTSQLAKLAEWFRQRLNEFLVAGKSNPHSALCKSLRPAPIRRDDGCNALIHDRNIATHDGRTTAVL